MFNQKRSKLVKNIPLLKLKNILTLIISVLTIFIAVNQSVAQDYKVKTIVIDAGHGGRDGATHGLYSTEKDVALKTALNLGKAIQDSLKDVKIIYTRTDDTFIPLYERIGIANNAKADLFISIHCNDMPVIRGRKDTGTRGTETFVSGMGRLGEQDEVIKRENASMFLETDYKKNYEGFDADNTENNIILKLMKDNNRVQSLKLAKAIQQEYVNVGRLNRGVQEKSLAVLARASMPAVLTEIGFISNSNEEDYMNSQSGQKEIVNCLLRAIKLYKDRLENAVATN